MKEQSISARDIETYNHDGLLIVKGLYSPDEMRDWKERIVRHMEEQHALDDPSGVKVWLVDDLDPFFLEALTGPRIVEVLHALIGPSVEFLSVKPVYKNSNVSFGSPWHQDWFYWRGTHKHSVWIALDAADTTNGCLKMIPGSHLTVAEMTRIDEDKGFSKRVDEKSLEGRPVQDLVVEQGDVVFFHDLTLHASHPNTSGRDRWSFIATYRDATESDTATIWKNSVTIDSPASLQS